MLQGPELTMELTLYFQSGRQEEAEQFYKYATRVSVFLFLNSEVGLGLFWFYW